MEELSGKRAIVFGASSGVGAATARRFAEAGAEVVLTGRDAGRLEEARAQAGPRAMAAVLDGKDAAAVRAFFDEQPAFHHVVVAAGQTSRGGPITSELTIERFRETFEGKFWVQMNVVHAAAPRLERGGSITLISGGAAHRALVGMVNVAAVNGALEATLGPLARELAPTRVNAISPGTLHTGYWRGVPDEQLEAIFRRTADALPAGRVGTAEDIAQAALFLAQNSFITGTVVQVDGGIQHSSL